jgi:hypothetical protein
MFSQPIVLGDDPFAWGDDSALGKDMTSLEEQLLCPICSEYQENPFHLKCGHSFCSMCIRKTLRRNPQPRYSDKL